MRLRVTVGIPVWNAEQTLRTAIESVLRQTYSDWELLLVNDGSTDRSAEIAQSFNDRRIRYFHEASKRGLVCRLNQMIEFAEAPLFARFDSDDMMHPERLARQVSLLERNPDLVLCGSAAYVMDENSCVYGVRADDMEGSFQGIRSGFIHPTVMGRTAWFRRNPYDEAYVRAEDAELWQRVDENTKCELIRDPLLFYRQPKYPQVKTYSASCRSMRRVIRRYSPARVGLTKTMLLLGAWHLKEWAYRGAAAVNCTGALVSRRNRSCTAEEKACADRILADILESKAPIGKEKIPEAYGHMF